MMPVPPNCFSRAIAFVHGECWRCRSVDDAHGGFDGRVELEDIVVDGLKRIHNVLTVKTSGICEHADFHIRKISVAKIQSVFDHCRKIRMQWALRCRKM